MRDTRPLDPDKDVRVFERALSDSVFQRLAAAIDAIGDENLDEGYNTTFWYARGAEPRSLVEIAISNLIELAAPDESCIGTEWWIGRLEPGKRLPFHFDRDLTRSRVHGEHRYPMFGSILYLNTFASSPTVLLGQVPGDTPKIRLPETPAYRRSVDAVENRYVVFRGDLRHGVAAEGDEDPGNREGEMRVTLLVNYWSSRPMPPICRDFDGTVYRRLLELGAPFAEAT